MAALDEEKAQAALKALKSLLEEGDEVATPTAAPPREQQFRCPECGHEGDRTEFER